MTNTFSKATSQNGPIKYYTSEDGFNYVDTFNKEWIYNQINDLSGPAHCNNCAYYGSITQNDVKIFLGYCLNCAYHLYEQKRGPGFQGFWPSNSKLIYEYEYPDYLINYKFDIFSLICNNNNNNNNKSLNDKIDYQDYVNYLNYVDTLCDCVASSNLSESDEEL